MTEQSITKIQDRYARQEAFPGIGKEGQEKLLQSRVTIIGLGALGTVTADRLCRAGVGFIRMVDRDYVEYSNLQRQALYREQDAKEGTPKAAAAAELLREINSEIILEPVIADVNSSNIDQLIQDVDLVMDASDNFEVRFLINEACQVHHLPWIYGGAIGATGMTMNFPGGEHDPCLCCLICPEENTSGTEETCSTVGVLNTLTSIVASLQCTEALKFLAGSGTLRHDLLSIDLWLNEVQQIQVPQQPDCPVCQKHQYQYYGKKHGTQAISLCGRDSVQVIPPHPAEINLKAFAEQLTPLGTVRCSKYTLDFDNGTIGIKLFRDGRAIIKHVTDEKKARSIYAEYIGM